MTFLPIIRVVMTVTPKGDVKRAVWAAPTAPHKP
jgi:hypothetical protein